MIVTPAGFIVIAFLVACFLIGILFGIFHNKARKTRKAIMGQLES